MSNLINDTTLTDGVKTENPIIANSHFFIEVNTSFAQTTAQAFGPKDSDTFKTTSKVTFSGTKKIFAVTSGRLLIQPQLDGGGVPTSLVNAILMPTTQPISGLPIKYIIYRGLNRADFVATVSTTGSKVNSASSVTFVQEVYSDFYGLIDNSVDFWTKYLGYPTATADVAATGDFPGIMLLNDLFFNKSTTYDDLTETISEDAAKAFEIPSVSKGLHIGNATGNIGIDIVLDLYDTVEINGSTSPFKFDLNFARSADYSIDLTTAGLTSFQKKMLRDVSCQFMDLAAFLGMHANGCGSLSIDGTTTPLTTTADVYSKMSGLDTKNNVYLNILAHRGRSYNYYDQHMPIGGGTDNFKFGFDETALTTKAFGTYDWPLEVIDFSSNSFSESRLLLQLYTRNREEMKCYNIVQDFVENSKSGFFEFSPDDPAVTTGLDYTPLMELKINEESTNTSPIAQAHYILYEGSKLEAFFTVNDGGTTYNVLTELDNVQSIFKVANIGINSLLEGSKSIQGINSNSISMVTTDEGISVVSSKENKDFIKKVTDEIDERITFESLRFGSKEKSTNPPSFNGIDKKESENKLFDEEANNYYIPQPPLILVRKYLYLDGEEILTLSVEDLKGNVANKFHLGILESEYAPILTKIDTLNIVNPTIYLLDPKAEYDFVDHKFDENDLYKFDIAIAGESDSELISLYFFDTPLNVFTRDGKYFFSKAYGDTTNEIPEIIDKKISRYEPTAYVTVEIEPPLSPADGVIVRRGYAVDVSTFQSYSLDTSGFLMEFIDENGVKYMRFYGMDDFDTKEAFDLTPLEYNHYDEARHGVFLRLDDYLDYINKPLSIFSSGGSIFADREDDYGFKTNILDKAYEFKRLEPDVGNLVRTLKLVPDYNDSSIVAKFIQFDHTTSSPYYSSYRSYKVRGRYAVEEELFTSPDEQNTKYMILDPHVQGFRDRQVGTLYFSGLTHEEKETVYSSIILICLGMETFIRDRKAILEYGCTTNSALMTAISDELTNWKDNLAFDSYGKIKSFRRSISLLNQTILRNKRELQASKCEDRMSTLMTLVSSAGMDALTTGARLEFLETCIKKTNLTGAEQSAVLKVLYSSADTVTESNEVLDFMAIIKQGSSKTNFERLFFLMNEEEWYSKIPLVHTLEVGFGGEDNTYRRHFIFALFTLWQNSKYFFLDINSDGTCDEKGANSFFSEGQDGYTYMTSAPYIMVFDADDNGRVIGDINHTYVPEETFYGKKIRIREKIYENQEVYYPPQYGGTQTQKTLISNEIYGDYHIFQPILALGFTSTWELKLSQPISLYPAFLHYYAKSYLDAKRTAAVVGFIFDVVLEAVLFWATGGLSTIRHLRHLTKLSTAGRAMIGVTQGQIILGYGTLTIEVASGVLFATTNLIANSTTDPDVKAFYDKLGFLFIGLSISSAFVNTRIEKFVRAQGDQCKALYEALSPGQKTIANLDPEIIAVINKFAGDMDDFKAFLTAEGFGALKTKLDNALVHNNVIAKFYNDFNIGLGQLSNSQWAKLNANLNFVDNWKLMSDAQAPLGLRTDFLILKDNATSKIVADISSNPNAKYILDYDFSFETFGSFIRNTLKPLSITEQATLIAKPHFLELFYIARSRIGNKFPRAIAYSVDDVRALMNSSLKKLFADVLANRNAFKNLAEIAAEYQKLKSIKVTSFGATEAQNINKLSDLVNMFRSTHNVLVGKQYNILEVTMKKYINGVSQGVGPTQVYISGSRKKLMDWFPPTAGNPNLPNLPAGITDISSKAKYDQLAIWSKRSRTGQTPRDFDTEVKFLFNLIDSDLTGVTRIDIEMNSIIKACGSCQGFLVSTIKHFESIGIELNVVFRAHPNAGTSSAAHKLLGL